MVYALATLKINHVFVMIIIVLQHPFRKYSYSTKNKQWVNNRCINFGSYNCYINQTCSFKKNKIKNNVKDFCYKSKVNDILSS